ncbi:MAG: transglutaminase-like domain-containing protein [Bacteroidetes bacterium]|nr:transglutaminase-like domain-containing protein [Bacteroidota bacterium]
MVATIENKELNALVHLLDEPDETVFDSIREKIHSFGKEAIPYLEKALEVSFDNSIQERAGEIIRNIQLGELLSDFTDWINTSSSDLLKGFLLVTRSQYPELNEEALTIRVEQMKMDAWLELNDNLTALENIKVLNHILYQVHNFDGNKINLFAPQNFYLNTFLETRKGSALSLGILYIILARKLNIPVYGVNLPQHFILAYVSELAAEVPSLEDVLFYINPFNKGAVFTRKEIELFIQQLKIDPDRSYFAPCSNIDIIKRLIENLIYCYTQLGYPDKIEDLERLLKLTEKPS